MAKTAAERMRAYRARKKIRASVALREGRIANLTVTYPAGPELALGHRALALRMVDDLFEARMLNGAGRRKAREIIDGWP